MDSLAIDGNCDGKETSPVPTSAPLEQPWCCCPAYARWLRRCIPIGCLDEAKELMKLAAPVAISQILFVVQNIVSIMFCGHLGKEELDATTVGNAMASVLGYYFGIGFCSAVDTLLSQTFGAKNMKQIGVILQQSLVMLILICFPCWAIFINTNNLLILFKQDPKVSRLADDYVLFCAPVLLMGFIYELQCSFLRNQGITVPLIFIGVTAVIIHVILVYVFVFMLHLGVQGAALALNATRLSQVIVAFLYIWKKKLHIEIWGGWSWECLQNWWPLVKLAIPSILSLSFEWWIYDIGIILAGLISVTEMGAQSVVFQVSVLFYMIPYSMGVAASVRVGNSLGAGNTEQAKISSTTAFLCTAVLAVVTVTIIGASRTVIARVLTNDKEIIELVARTLLIYIVVHIFEAFACTSNGVLRGMGKQKFGAVTFAIAYYVIGLPLAVTFMFPAKLGVLGLWGGIAVCTFIPGFFLTGYIFRANWKDVTEEAQERAGLKQKLPIGLGSDFADSVFEEEQNQSSIDLPDRLSDGHLVDHQPFKDFSSPVEPIRKDHKPKKTLIFRRVLVFVAAVVILVVGILLRVLLDHN